MITRIDHVWVAVADLDEAKAFYARTFGLVTVHEEVNEEQGVREAMLAPGPDVDGPGARLQLLAPLSPSSTIATFRRSGPQGRVPSSQGDRRRPRRARRAERALARLTTVRPRR